MKQIFLDALRAHWLLMAFWAAVLGVAGFFAAKHWARVRQFLMDVREELKKCTWPTWQELRESTVVVAVSVLMLGLFVFGADFVFSRIFGAVLYAAGLRKEW